MRAGRPSDGPLERAAREIGRAKGSAVVPAITRLRPGGYTSVRCGASRAGCPELGGWRRGEGLRLFPRMRVQPEGEWPVEDAPLYELPSRWEHAFRHGDDPLHRPRQLRAQPGPSRIRYFDDVGAISDRAVEEAGGGLTLRSAEDARLYPQLSPGFGRVVVRCPQCRRLSVVEESTLR